MDRFFPTQLDALIESVLAAKTQLLITGQFEQTSALD
jgi:hypothetical protein